MRRGVGVAQDPDLARLWYCLAAAQGNAPAKSNLAKIKPINPEIDEMVVRALGGDVECQRDLAIRLHDGDGISRDEVASAIWLRKAAEGGDPWSQTTLAIELRATKEPGKERESFRWLSFAADQGDARARLTLGLQYGLGIGTAVDWESFRSQPDHGVTSRT